MASQGNSSSYISGARLCISFHQIYYISNTGREWVLVNHGCRDFKREDEKHDK